MTHRSTSKESMDRGKSGVRHVISQAHQQGLQVAIHSKQEQTKGTAKDNTGKGNEFQVKVKDN